MTSVINNIWLYKANGNPIQRNSNLELYRIIVMLAIVAHHYVVQSGIISEGEITGYEFNARNLFFWLLGMWGKTGINCFVLITGYFMCKSQITIRKFFKLLMQITFYNFFITLIFQLSGYEGLSWKGSLVSLLLCLLPIRSVADGFISCFILFWLTIPFLNVLIANIGRKQHLMLVFLCLFTYTFMIFVPGSIVIMNYVSWFIVLYFISSYIRLYPENIYRCNSSKTWGWLSFAFILLAMGSVTLLLWLNDFFGWKIRIYFFVYDSNAILALLVAITTFMFFKNLNIPHSHLINAVASTTFGVLCIHTNSYAMLLWLWRDTVDCIGHITDTYYYLYALLAIICVFSVCSLIDYVRIHTVETWAFNWIDKKITK